MTTTDAVPSIKTNSARAWIKAARPITLTAALIPVLTASALAYSHGAFRLLPAVLCAIFAGLIQIASNFINDLFDFLKGTDGDDRLGPLRSCAMGWITPKAMRWGIGVVMTLAAVVGLWLVNVAVWQETRSVETLLALLLVGAACLLFAFLYTTLLSYRGGGDVLVYVFFGLVPVVGTYYVQALDFVPELLWLAAGVGLAIDTLLIVNNFRDRETDRRSGKRPLIARRGATFGLRFYLAHGILAYFCVAGLLFYGFPKAGIALLPYLWLHLHTWRTMKRIYEGKALNKVLGMTSRNMLVFGILTLLGLVL